MRFTVGARLGPYEIQSLIGAGGMGEVYRALDVRLGRYVAIKLPPDAIAHDPDMRQRFEHEARASATLSHPHICAVFDVGQHEDTPFIVMEFLDGETLARRLSGGPLSSDTAVPIAAHIADALTEAHRCGVVHRDLKPSNVMLVRTGAKLLDFGIAKVTSALAAAETTHAWNQNDTGPDAIVGTVQYMSPEQLEGRELSTSTDLFSFGAVLYEMLAGRPPFTADSKFGLIAAILQRSPAPVHTVASDVPPAIGELIEECLSKEPQHRPTAGNVLTRLRAASQGAHHGTRQAAGKPATRAIRSLAVLALATNLRHEAEDAFAGGMVDSLITSLSAFPSLQVISRMSSQQFASAPAPVATAARELHVDAVVGVEVHEAETGRLTVDAELIAGDTQSRLWSGRFSCDRSEVLQVPEQIAWSIGRKVGAGSRKARALHQRRVNRLAHEHHLKGVFLLENRIGSWIESSFDEFTAAVRVDQAFAPAHVGLSRCYATAAVRMSSGAPTRFIGSWREGFDQAEAEARMAIALDPDLGSAHSALAQVHWMRYRLADAGEAFQRALALDPGDSSTRVRYSLFLNSIGRVGEAMAHARFARERDPLTTLPFECLAVVLYTTRQFATCIECCDEGLDVNPHSGLLHYYRGLSLAMLGRLDEALVTLTTACAKMADDSSTIAALATVHARRGEMDAVRALVQTLIDRGDDLVSLGEVYAAVDRPQDALDALEKAFELSAPKLISIGVDPAFDALRERPRFKRLLVGTGLAAYLAGEDNT